MRHFFGVCCLRYVPFEWHLCVFLFISLTGELPSTGMFVLISYDIV